MMNVAQDSLQAYPLPPSLSPVLMVRSYVHMHHTEKQPYLIRPILPNTVYVPSGGLESEKGMIPGKTRLLNNPRANVIDVSIAPRDCIWREITITLRPHTLKGF